MEYRVFDKDIIVRMDPDEEIIETLEKVCTKENITLAEVNGLGALKEFTVGLFDTTEKKFLGNDFTMPAEITSLTGTVTTQDGKFYAHLHMSAANSKAQVYGGHLQRAVISATGEIVIHVIDGCVEREFSPEIGLNLMKFL